MEKIKQSYVLPTLVECHSTIASFVLWMPKGAHDIFALVINFLGLISNQRTLPLAFFEATYTSRQTLAKNKIIRHV
jgi:hypothetical protein